MHSRSSPHSSFTPLSQAWEFLGSHNRTRNPWHSRLNSSPRLHNLQCSHNLLQSSNKDSSLNNWYSKCSAPKCPCHSNSRSICLNSSNMQAFHRNRCSSSLGQVLRQ